jgi:putative ABC transport system substrate-binding protein
MAGTQARAFGDESPAVAFFSETASLANKRALFDAAAQYHWPTVHSTKDYAEAGGVIAYGADYAENCRNSCPYVDKIFRDAKPGDLPVQQPVKFQLVINLKTAKSMGLTVPSTLLGRADEVIE